MAVRLAATMRSPERGERAVALTGSASSTKRDLERHDGVFEPVTLETRGGAAQSQHPLGKVPAGREGVGAQSDAVARDGVTQQHQPAEFDFTETPGLEARAGLNEWNLRLIQRAALRGTPHSSAARPCHCESSQAAPVHKRDDARRGPTKSGRDDHPRSLRGQPQTLTIPGGFIPRLLN